MSLLAGAITGAIASAAAKIGAELVGKFVGGVFGDQGGAIAEKVVTSVAEKLGVEPAEILQAKDGDLERAVASTEAEMPEIILAHVESQKLANQLQLAEMSKDEAPWTWAWRPAWMWGLLAAWAWYVFGVPALNLVLHLAGASARIVLWVDISTLLYVTGIFSGFYMGGHTIKDVVAKAAATLKSRGPLA